MVAKPLCPLYKNIIKPLDRARYPELRLCYSKVRKTIHKRECSDIRIVVYYPLLILSTNSFGESISILEKPNHFLPKSLMDAPM